MHYLNKDTRRLQRRRVSILTKGGQYD